MSYTVDPDKLWQAIADVRDAHPRVADDVDSWVIVEAVMTVVKPLPTREQIAEALHKHEMCDVWDDAGCNDKGDDGYEHISCKERFLERADVVLKLMRGEG